MLLAIPDLLDADELARVRSLVETAGWADGRATAGTQSAQVKRNLQLPELDVAAREAQGIVLAALDRSALFFSAALPRRIYPPLFNRYEGGMHFGSHVDNAIRTHAASGQRIRTDLSATLFLAEPESYDGGELVIDDTYGSHAVKLPAGHLVLYPATSLHRVEPVTRGSRLACFFWLESLVRDDGERTLLFDLDAGVGRLRQAHGDGEIAVALTGIYHNLLRRWAVA
ncbi:MAG: Fe2+-dependent dioxygenase [Betaproteobacteria bacterium]|nr:Fe2+-dependent dioxygenase [Betaproteobacteria bacterium]